MSHQFSSKKNLMLTSAPHPRSLTPKSPHLQAEPGSNPSLSIESVSEDQKSSEGDGDLESIFAHRAAVDGTLPSGQCCACIL